MAKPNALLRAVKADFSVLGAKERADRLLALPPPIARLERPVPKGVLVARFFLPLDLLKAQNWSRHRYGTTLAKVKTQLFKKMWPQCMPLPKEPLPGRPFVRCIRFSSTQPDRGADTFKMAIDILCAREPGNDHRLNFLRNDRDVDAELHQTWEPAPPSKGFGLIEVFTGEPLTGDAP